MKIIKANFIDKTTKTQVFESIRFFEDHNSDTEILEYFKGNIFDEQKNEYDFSDEVRYAIEIEKMSLRSWYEYLVEHEKRIKKNTIIEKENREKALLVNKAIYLSFCGGGGEYPLLFNSIQCELEIFLEKTQKSATRPQPISVENNGEGKAIYQSEIPQVSFDDVVGLEAAKKAIRDKFIDPDTDKNIYNTLKIRTGGGILMYGVPGTGKTMLAQAVAHEINAKFFSVKCSDIMSKWFGESEKAVKQLFAQARRETKSVLFLDEIDALTKKTNLINNCAGTLISEMKAQMQGVDSSNRNVLIIGATNHPELIDPAFLRPGRFDVRAYIKLPNKDARISIIQKRLKEIPHTLKAEDLDELGNKTYGFNCSYVDYLCEAAKIIAKDMIKASQREEIRVEPRDFTKALQTVHSTVDINEAKRLEKWSI